MNTNGHYRLTTDTRNEQQFDGKISRAAVAFHEQYADDQPDGLTVYERQRAWRIVRVLFCCIVVSVGLWALVWGLAHVAAVYGAAIAKAFGTVLRH
jgi:hypothetical protein